MKPSWAAEQGLRRVKMAAGTRKLHRLAVIRTELQLRLKSKVE